MVSVTVWNEYVHEREDEEVAEIYPEGIHTTIADALAERGHETRTATLQEPEHGLAEAVLDETEVLTWWGHAAHDEVDDGIVERVAERVQNGMGLLVLHSAHASKPFKRLLGTPCDLTWREAGERERCWVVDPGHPITDGLADSLVFEEAEMYGEPFGVPEPDRLVFTSWFEGGEVFRSGCCYRRGRGSIFYFRPGHETYPIYHRDDVQRVLGNAVEWAAPTEGADAHAGNRNVDPRESL
ncbi:ThuA domain-containing protein [Haloarcula montana]|uniref:ThuA domain-containing protein n=1 Tax=Haloarcula montana TaxID=3111776 RepID=UPI002D76B205|nr:ThuA domain-containing protein [Haloarcula sp. GH36]